MDVGLTGVLYHSGNLGDLAMVQAYTGVDDSEIFSQVPAKICDQVMGNRLEPASGVGSALMVVSNDVVLAPSTTGGDRTQIILYQPVND